MTTAAAGTVMTTATSMGTRTSIWTTQVNRPANRRMPAISQSVSAGKFSERDLPDYSARNFEERGFTVGIGG